LITTVIRTAARNETDVDGTKAGVEPEVELPDDDEGLDVDVADPLVVEPEVELPEGDEGLDVDVEDPLVADVLAKSDSCANPTEAGFARNTE